MTTAMRLSLIFGLVFLASTVAVSAQNSPLGGGLDMTIKPSDALGAESEAGRPAAEEEERKDVIRGSEKWRRMERIEAQGGERADLSKRSSRDVKMSPVIGGRRQAGNPERYGDDVKRRVPFGLEFMREF